MSEPEQSEAPPPDPVEVALAEIEGATDEDLRGPDRLGSLAFDEADVGVMREIASILNDAQGENRSYWSSGRQAELNDHATAITNLIGQVKSLRADEDSSATAGRLPTKACSKATTYARTEPSYWLDRPQARSPLSTPGPQEARAPRRHRLRRERDRASAEAVRLSYPRARLGQVRLRRGC